MSATCKALERDIDTKLCNTLGDDQPVVVAAEQEPLSDRKDTTGPESFEHNSKADDADQHGKPPTPPSKTMIFTGSGTVVKKPGTTKTSGSIGKGGSVDTTTMPERDTVAEHLLVRELQNRIRLIGRCEEEEVQNEDVSQEDGDSSVTSKLNVENFGKEKDVITAAMDREPNMNLGSSGIFAELKSNLSKQEAVETGTTYGADDDTDDDDGLMLEMMRGADTASTNNDPAEKSEKSARKKKWGRKGRKVRNNDPYGMFVSPDVMLGEGSRSEAAPVVGVTVKGGKYGHKGYTRQTGYGGMRTMN